MGGVKIVKIKRCCARCLVRSNLMLGNFYFLWVYLTNLKCARIIKRPESHLLIHLPYFYHLNSKKIQYSIFNIANQYRILIKALPTNYFPEVIVHIRSLSGL